MSADPRLQDLALEMSPQEFETWIEPLELREEVKGIRVVSPTPQHRDYVRRVHGARIAEALGVAPGWYTRPYNRLYGRRRPSGTAVAVMLGLALLGGTVTGAIAARDDQAVAPEVLEALRAEELRRADAAPPPVPELVPCLARDELAAGLWQSDQELPVWRGLIAESAGDVPDSPIMIELFLSAHGSWSLVTTDVARCALLEAVGDHGLLLHIDQGKPS